MEVYVNKFAKLGGYGCDGACTQKVVEAGLPKHSPNRMTPTKYKTLYTGHWHRVWRSGSEYFIKDCRAKDRMVPIYFLRQCYGKKV